MKLPLHQAAARAAFAAVLLTIGSAFGQEQSNVDIAVLYNRGTAAFAAGDWAKAIPAYEELLARAEPTPQLEPIYFSLAAAYYNAKDFPKSIAAFKTYQEKFPKGAQFNRSQMALAEAYLSNQDFEAARKILTSLESDPALREASLFAQARVAKVEGKPENGIVALEKLVKGGIKSRTAAAGAILLAPLYAEAKRSGDAVRTLADLQRHVDLVENVVQLNAIGLKIGDSLFKQEDYEAALRAYRTVRLRAEVIEFQQARIASMRSRLAQTTAALRAEPKRAPELVPVITALNASIAEASGLLASFEKLPDFAPGLYVRMGRSYYEMGKRWESIVLTREIFRRFPDAPEVEAATFSEAVALSELKRVVSARAACERYLQKYPTGVYAPTAAYLRASLAMEDEDYAAAEKLFGEFLTKYPESGFREQARFALAQLLFTSGRYDEAMGAFGAFLQEFPGSPTVEDASYRITLSRLFSGQTEQATAAFNTYLTQKPDGRFAPDAKYRLAFIDYSAGNNEAAIAKADAWLAEFPKDPQRGEVLSLKGDALAALGRVPEAISAYQDSSQQATTDAAISYALGEATTLLRKQGDWEAISKMYEASVQAHPESSTVPTAVYWIGRARVKAGRVDEAKSFIAETIQKNLGDPDREGVEQLITQLAQLCAKKSTKPDAPDPAAELATLLAPKLDQLNRTAQAREAFGQAELAGLRKQPAIAAAKREEIATKFTPDDLSPVLLAQAGDFHLARGKPEAAMPFYDRLKAEYPKSDVVDFAYAGKAWIAYDAKDYASALKLYTDGTDRIAAIQKLKDLTLGKARTLLALNQPDEAEKVFQQVASMREWRGEATAESIFSLGEIERLRGDWAAAIAHYDKVHVAYRKFLPWVARAYLQSGEASEKIGKPAEAAKTYQEMLNDERLANFPETAEARKRLASLPKP